MVDGNKSAFFEFKSGTSRKFWRIVKNGTKITTHYGRIGTLGQINKKDYGSNVDKVYDKLIKSKRKKGYIETPDYGDKDPKEPSKVKREFMKQCRKAEKSKILNPNQISQDCEGLITTHSDSELKWYTGWYKESLKNGYHDWDKYKEYFNKKRVSVRNKKKVIKKSSKSMKKSRVKKDRRTKRK